MTEDHEPRDGLFMIVNLGLDPFDIIPIPQCPLDGIEDFPSYKIDSHEQDSVCHKRKIFWMPSVSDHLKGVRPLVVEVQEVAGPESPGFLGVDTIVPFVIAGDDEQAFGRLPQDVGDVLIPAIHAWCDAGFDVA